MRKAATTISGLCRTATRGSLFFVLLLGKVSTLLRVQKQIRALSSAMIVCGPTSKPTPNEKTYYSTWYRDVGGGKNNNRTSFVYAAAASGLILGAGAYMVYKSKDLQEASSVAAASFPEFELDEVAVHDNTKDGIWVIYGDSVYDITQFVENHPGGSKIMLAAGKSLEPFWNLYAIHDSNAVKELLGSMKIGKLSAKAFASTQARNEDAVDDAWSKEPGSRHPAFILNSVKPFDAETPPDLITDKFITPNELFFIRNHLPVPDIDAEKHEISLEIPGNRSICLKMEDLKKFPKHHVTATLMCAGNRRNEMQKHKPIYGAMGGNTAISNANWAGAKLRDVLIHAGLTDDPSQHKHVHFEGVDTGSGGARYGSSIPIEKAMSVQGDVLLAYEMNGQPLPRDHGYPVRALVPGVVGARNVKWLGKITVSDKESDNHWQQNDYKVSPPTADRDSAVMADYPAIYESPVQSAICIPKDGSEIPEDSTEITVKGYAWSGGGNGILRVDVSIDGGQTWQSADLKQTQQPLYRRWAWTLWEAEIDLPEGHNGPIEIMCKAVDTSYNTQPEDIRGIWNVRGFLANPWHKVGIRVATE